MYSFGRKLSYNRANDTILWGTKSTLIIYIHGEKSLRKVLIYGLIFLQAAVIVSLTGELRETLQARSRVGELENKREELKKKQESLQGELQYVTSEYYVEQVARDELHLSKEGEEVVIIQDKKLNGNNDRETQRQAVLGESKSVGFRKIATNWRQWFNVFFGRE